MTQKLFQQNRIKKDIRQCSFPHKASLLVVETKNKQVSSLWGNPGSAHSLLC